MARQNENSKVQVVLFVEGDTDEVLFKALIDYYKGVSKTELNPCKICNLRGNDGNAKLNDLYGKVRKAYLKGYQTKELVASLDMSVIRKKNADALTDLEKALNVSVQ